MDLILQLYNNLLYVKGDKDITVTLGHIAIFFKKGLLCAFSEGQVNRDEELNQNFINATKLAAPAAAAKILPVDGHCIPEVF